MAATTPLHAADESVPKVERPPVLHGRKALVVGIANEHSIASGCARAFRELGAEVAITYGNEKTRSYVEPIARRLAAPIFMQLDVAIAGQLEAVFDRIDREWGRLDIVVHSIAGGAGQEIRGRLVDCSAGAFCNAMDVSVHSFVRIAKLAGPLMREGGTMFAMSYLGATHVVPNYDVMGPVKAALEAACRYLAYEMSPQGIRVHAISPGPLHTRAATGLKDFDRLLNDAVRRAPVGADIDIMDIGYACAYLATPYARHMTGSTLFVDGGVNIMA